MGPASKGRKSFEKLEEGRAELGRVRALSSLLPQIPARHYPGQAGLSLVDLG